MYLYRGERSSVQYAVDIDRGKEGGKGEKGMREFGRGRREPIRNVSGIEIKTWPGKHP